MLLWRQQELSEPGPQSAYVLLRNHAAVIPGLSGLVWVTGSDTVTFIDGLLSRDIAAMSAGETASALLLAPNGKLRATLLVLRGEDHVGLVCDAGRVEEVVGGLSRFKIRVDVDIEVDCRSVWDVWGPEATAALGPVSPLGGWNDDNGVLLVRAPFRHSPLPRVIGAGTCPDLPVLDAVAVDAVRIELGEPVMGVDLDDKTIPQEGVDVAGRVDFNKGCYLGQELVARIDSRGHVNRRLCGLILDGEEVPPIGSAIVHEGKVVGAVSSAAWSDGLAAVIALALVRVEVATGSSITIEGVAGSVVKLPIRA